MLTTQQIENLQIFQFRRLVVKRENQANCFFFGVGPNSESATKKSRVFGFFFTTHLELHV
jgi:hypothetical protein